MICTSTKLVALAALICAAGCSAHAPAYLSATDPGDQPPAVRKILASAREQIKTTRGYTQDYLVIAYPGGDVPAATGACTDVIIRSFRNAGVDLQREVHRIWRQISLPILRSGD